MFVFNFSSYVLFFFIGLVGFFWFDGEKIYKLIYIFFSFEIVVFLF